MNSSHVEEAAAQRAEAGDVVPATWHSLVELLRTRAAEERPGTGYLFLADGEVEEESLGFAELDRRARAVAATLQRLAGPGERALLLYPPGLQFLVAFFGCLEAGIVAVPAYPPRPRRSPDRLRVLLADARPALVLTTGALARHGATWAADLPALAAARWIVTDEPWSPAPAASAPEVVDVPPEAAANWQPPELGPGTVAFLQYTSGSTSAPKGVVVSHGNLLHNQFQMESAFRAGPSSVVVSWLPPYHDMGLIGALLQPLYAGASCVLMSPAAFLLKPLRWLLAISRYRATISGGPDFAYALCVERSSPEQRRELDLSCWEVAFNGAEPVRAATLDRFTAAFAPHGFRREAFQPCYGLAEATLLVAGGGGAPRVLTLAAGPLARHRVVPLAPGQPDARQLVGCGHAQGGQRLAIVDPETLAPSPAGAVGEIWVGGPSVAQGYWGRPAESGETFGACLAGSGEGPFLRTGDLGFLADGELFVTGRIKDLVILRGRNHYPQDIEVAAARSHPALRPGCCAAFAVDGAAGEVLVVVQEIARHREADAAAAVEAIRAEIVAEHDVAPGDVVLVPAGTIPKTSSGKIQRAACRRRYLAGALEVVLQSPVAAAVPDASVDATADVAPASRELRQEVARVLRLPASELPGDQPLSRLGLDSLTAFELAARIEERWGHRLPMPSLLGDCSMDDLAGELAERGSGAVAAPPRASLEESASAAAAPLSHGQRALWYLRQLAPASTAYHLAAAARIAGDLDRPALRRAFQALLDRHPALRTTFAARGGDDPLQQAQAGAEIAFFEWQAEDWSEPELVRRLADEAARPFDLERGPLLRVGLAERGGGAPVLLVACHHIAADFWSLAVLAEELGRLYEACRAGPAAAGLGPAPPPPIVLAERQARRLEGGEGERLWAFWDRQLAGAPQELELPADRPRPRVQGWRGARVRSALAPELTAGLGALGRSLGATPFTALLGGFLALLHRVSGQDDLLVGVPTSGRNAVDLARAVGYHVNPIVVRSTTPAGASFADRLAVLRQTLLAAFAHQDFPFALLAERLQPVRDPGRAPLFQAMIVHHQTPAFAPAGLAELALGEPGARLELGALTLEGVPLPERSSQLDLALFAAATADGRLALHLQYDSDLFDAVSAQRLLAHLEALLAAAVAEPARPAESLPMLAEGELHQLVREWNSAGLEHDRAPCLHDLVAAQAARTPEATALVCGGEQLSYRDLVGSAGRLAGHLRSLGAGPEVRVAVLAERTPELVIGLLAVLAAGAAYVPLDPSYPAARLAFALDDSRPRLVLTHRRLRGRLPSVADRRDFGVVELGGRWWESAPPAATGPAAPPAATVAPGNLAYLIYTSGSTGRPKAVAVEHRSAVALCAWAGSAFSSAELAGVLAATSIGFDLSVFELFAPLACGGAVILVDDVLALTRPDGVPAQPPVTLVNTVPSAMAELLRAGAVPASVTTVALAGEPLRGSLLRAIHAGCGARRVLNLYGPSEDTTYSTWAELARGEERPSIGRPLANRVALVLDADLHPVPIGVPGELFLGGAGLARGYFGRPEATAERFLPDGVTGRAGERLYRTGDLARLLPDGRLDFLGRRDHQVKVRGFRLELGEVDAVLAAHPGVRAAVTLLRDDGAERRLVAYVAPRAELAAADLDSFLRQRLPPHAVPAVFVFLADLPRGAGGKFDRAALPAPEAAAAGDDQPRNPLEEVLAVLWCEALARDRIGIHDDLFALGAHSLLAARVAARLRLALGQDLPLSLVLASPTVAGLAAHLTGGGAAVLPLAPAPRQALMPTSAAQRRLWFLDRLAPGSAVYNLPLSVRLRGALDAGAFGQALDRVVRRHESLRTVLEEAGGRPWQRIAPPAPSASPVPIAAPLPLADLSALPVTAGEREAASLAQAAAARPFDLATGPLLRCLLLRLAPADHRLILVLHHAVADAASLELLLDELAVHYQDFAAGPPAASPAPPLQYADYASWELRAIEEGAFALEVAFWASRLAAAPAALALPADRPRPPARSGRGGMSHGELPPAAWSGLLRLARAAAATPFMALLAGWTALLYRLTGDEDLVVGTPIANRDRVELEGLIGMFVNTLALRCAPRGGEPAAGLVAAVRDTCLAAYAHRQVPFDLVVEALHPGRLPSRNPLFDVLLVLAPAPAPRFAGGLELVPEALATGTAKFDLTLFAGEREGGLDLALESDRDLFDAATASRLLVYLQNLLAEIAAAPTTPLADLQLLSAAERHQIVIECNAEAVAPAADRCLHELVAEQAERTPEAVAVDSAAGSVTYAELLRRAHGIARHLATLGVGPEVPVGILLERSPAMVAGLLGILAAGGAYLPLDPAYPDARLRFMLEDSGAGVVLTRAELARRLPAPGPPAVFVDRIPDGPEARPRPPHPDNLAYLIYTSGSTGRPKGVAIRHRAAVARLRWAQSCFSAAECAAVLASTSICFDLSVFELFVPLSRGGRAVLVQNALELAAAHTPPTLLNTVPSVLAELLRQGDLPPSVRTVNLAGEALPASLVARLAREPGVRRVLNLYGPSEDTTYSTWAELPLDGPMAVAPPIGRPLPGSSAHVLDRRLQPLPLGVAGELYLGGAGLARGYHARPQLTAERFVPSPCGEEPGARLYRTGDRVRRRPDGGLEFLGRADEQVKIRGFRIEPGEIEAALLAHPGVREAAVVARADAAGALGLVAYLVLRPEQAPGAAELRAFLGGRLPEPFVPGRLVTLSAMPATASGKLDRRALPALEDIAGATESEGGRLPAGPLEEVLAAIWAEVLGRESVGAAENFFALGGHSLLVAQVAARVRATLGVTLPLRSLFEAPTVAGLAARIAVLRGAAPPAAEAPWRRAGDDGPAPLSPGQQRLWFLHRLEPASPAYHIAGAVRLRGELRPDALAAALAAVVRRQPMLRTAFPLTPAGPVQVEVEGLGIPLPRLDLRALPAAPRAAEAARLAQAEARRPFVLAAGPPARLALVRLTAEEHLLLATLHHIAADGWSLPVLVRDLATAYGAVLGGGLEGSAVMAELPIRYSDYARAERRRLDGEPAGADLAYWRRQLAGSPAVLELPGDRPRPPVRGDRGRRRSFALPADAPERLAAAGRRQGASSFMVLLAAFLGLLHRLTREEDLLVGTPVANRDRVELEDVVGCFVNTLVLRTPVSGDLTFAALLARVREVTLAAFDHRQLPFERLVEELAPGRDLAHTPIFQLLLVLQNAPARAVTLPGLTLTEEEVDTATAKFDLTLAIAEQGGALKAVFEYASDLFDGTTVARFGGHFATLLGDALAAPERRCDELRLLAESEVHQLVVAWNDTRAELPPHLLHGLCEMQAARTPDAVAVVAEGRSLTFGELDRWANQIAHHLLAHGAGPGAVVGICAERSPELVAGLLGILKAGAAYLPLDPAAPRERLAGMAAEAGAPLLLTQERLAPLLPEGFPLVCLDRDREAMRCWSERPPALDLDGEDLAYVIYTSGSTGRPKGVMNSHRAIVNRLLWMQSAYGLTAADRVLQKTPFGFDVSVWELFWPLALGARLVLAAAGEHRDAAYLLALVGRAGVTVVHFVPAMLQAFLDLPDLAAGASLRLVVASGEALPPSLARRCLERLGARLENLYGPTEAAVDVTAWRCTRSTAGRHGIPIGRPIANARILLLDGGGRPAPIGVPAELHIGGVALARGYLRRPDLTAERFVPDPYGEAGARLYRTGDLARLLPGGEVDFLGRLDYQVKIRGVRIEPGEIEAALLERADLREAVVVARDDANGGSRLVAYLVAAAAPGPAPNELRDFLRGRLPEAMLPAAFVFLDRLPVGRTGKIDRRLLPAPEPAAPAAGYRPPRTAVETSLAEIWAEVLGLERAGIDDNFFAAGGHSLLATQLVSRIGDAFGLDLALREVFAAPTVSALAEVVTRGIVERAGAARVADLLARVEAGGDDRRPAA